MTKGKASVLIIAAACLALASCAAEKPADPTLTMEPEATTAPLAGSPTNSSQTDGPVLFQWSGVPVMPGAISGGLNELGDYSFTTAVPKDELVAYYELHMPELGWQQRDDVDSGESSTTLAFQNATDLAYIRISSEESNLKVTIHAFKVHGGG